MRYIHLMVLLCLMPAVAAWAQPHQDCLDALSVCQSSITIAGATLGTGLSPNEINPAQSCLPNGERNGVWLRLQVQNSGDLSFVISPTDPAADYNWTLFDLTSHSCADIATQGLEVACNASPDVQGMGFNAAGQTGAFSDPPYYGDLGFVFPAFTGDIAVTQGRTYFLYISNHSASAGGFTIDFSASTATLFNPATPSFSFLAPVTCGDDTLTVYFNKPIACASLQPADFTVNGSPVSAIISPDCQQGLVSAQVFQLVLASPIAQSQPYTLYLQDAISDDCGLTNASDSIPFTAASLSANAGSDYIFCKGDDIQLTLGAATPYAASVQYQWTASNPLVQAALSDPQAPRPQLFLTDIPADTVLLTFTVTSGGCTDTDTAYLYFRDCCRDYNATIAQFQNVGCFGASTGQATATATGSLASSSATTFQYDWSHGQQTFLATGLSANVVYTVTVTDPLGCVDTAQLTLSEPATPISVSSTGDILACHGDSSGTINLDVQGATPPYRFAWTNGDTTQHLTTIPAGSYTVTVTDANNCTITRTEQVTQPPSPLTLSGTANVVNCGASNGSLSANVAGGGSPYRYAWDNGATTRTLSGLVAGSYTLTVTDVFGCVRSRTYTVGTVTGLQSTTTAQPASCASSADGSAQITATGGLGPYSWQWSNGATTSTVTGLQPGTYTVTVTDATGCTVRNSATITALTTFSLTGQPTPVSCAGGSDGEIGTQASGSSGYTYLWSDGSTQAQRTGLAAGSYTVTVTDASGCAQQATFAVTQPNALQLTTSTLAVDCAGGNNGSATVQVSGGTAGYRFAWSNGATSATATNLSAQTYTVTVTDANGCTDTALATITAPLPLLATATATPVTCANSTDGSIATTVSGGTPPMLWSWSDGSTAAQRSGLAPGNYSATVTDANGCSFGLSANVGAPLALTLSANVTAVSCRGGSDGRIVVTTQNATPPLTYQWSASSVGNSAQANGLMAGNYALTVTDANGCTVQQAFTVQQPSQALAVQAIGGSLLCAGSTQGSVQALASGGTGSYTYVWSGGAAPVAQPTGLGAGVYAVTVTDGNGCTDTASATLTAPSPLVVNVLKNDVFCHGGSSGMASASVMGGTAPYQLLWSNNATTPNINSLTAGTYTVTVTDANGCTAQQSVQIQQPNPINIQLVPTGATCATSTDGAIMSQVTGGTSPFTFAWSNGATTPNLTSVAGGTYTLTVTDANNCTASLSANVATPNPLNLLAANVQPATCGQLNGLIVVIGTGGATPYQYTWSPNANVTGNSNTAANLGAGTYSVTVTDGNGCTATVGPLVFAPAVPFQVSATTQDPRCALDDGSIVLSTPATYAYTWSPNAATGNSAQANNLAAGAYSVTLTNAAGCDTTLSFTLGAPQLLSLSANVVDAACGLPNGSIAIQASGVAPIAFQWAGLPAVGDTNAVASLVAGNYTVTVTDGLDCIRVETFAVGGSDDLALDTVVTDPDCVSAGAIVVQPLQGTAPYQYAWSANAGVGNSAQATGLAEGQYAVTVTDALGCSDSLRVDLWQQGEFEIVTLAVNSLDCPGEATGSVDITTTSAATGLQYVWSDGSTSEDLTDVLGGNYSVTVTDPATGCSDVASYTLTAPAPLVVDYASDTIINVGQWAMLWATASDASAVFSWAGADGNVQPGAVVTVSPSQTTTYTLSVSLPNCSPQVYEVTVIVEQDDLVRLPDAFTPNNDGQNDVFRPVLRVPVDGLSWQVLNKWGEVMYASNDPNQGWDGTHRGVKMPNGSYVYVVRYLDFEGNEVFLKGQFLLIR